MATVKSARLETRVSPEQKQLIERAAVYTGRSVSDFVLDHVQEAARKVIEEYERLRLNQEQSRVLVEALLAPGQPNEKLQRAMNAHRNQVESR